MSRKIEEKELDYYCKKEKKLKKAYFKIVIIPRIVVKDYASLQRTMDKVIELKSRLDFLTDEIGALIYDASESVKNLKKEKNRSGIRELKRNTQKEVDKYNKEAKEIEAEMLSISSDKYEEERHRLTRILLEQNGINDEFFLSREFWEECVDISEHNSFLESVIMKDIGVDVKKKALIPGKS